MQHLQKTGGMAPLIETDCIAKARLPTQCITKAFLPPLECVLARAGESDE